MEELEGGVVELGAARQERDSARSAEHGAYRVRDAAVGRANKARGFAESVAKMARELLAQAEDLRAPLQPEP